MISVIEQLAEEDPDSAWASVPIDEGDLSNGYRDLTYQQLNDAANRAGQWLRRHLPAPLGPFQCFAYTGPNDLRYAAFAVAAGKLQKVVCTCILCQSACFHLYAHLRSTKMLRLSADDCTFTIGYTGGSAPNPGEESMHSLLETSKYGCLCCGSLAPGSKCYNHNSAGIEGAIPRYGCRVHRLQQILGRRYERSLVSVSYFWHHWLALTKQSC